MGFLNKYRRYRPRAVLWERAEGCKSGSLLLRSLRVERINRASPNTRGPVLKGSSMRNVETNEQNQHRKSETQ